MIQYGSFKGLTIGDYLKRTLTAFERYDDYYYMYNPGEGFKYLRICLLCMAVSGLINIDELLETMFFATGYAREDEELELRELKDYLFNLQIFKVQDISDFDDAIRFLDTFPANSMIEEHSEFVFLNDRIIVTHGHIIYPGTHARLILSKHLGLYETCGCISYESYKDKIEPEMIYDLDLTKSYENNDYWAFAKPIMEYPSSSLCPLKSSREGAYIYIIDEEKSYIYIYDVAMGSIVIRCEGIFIAYAEHEIIFLDKENNMLFRIDGLNITPIYKLNKFEVCIWTPEYDRQDILCIRPLIRALSMPLYMDFEGNGIALDRNKSYIWDSFVLLESEANSIGNEPINSIEYDGVHFKNEWQIEKCSVNEILSFFKRIKSIHYDFFLKTQSFQKMISFLSSYVNPDEDISELLLRFRRDSIYMEEEFWDSMLDIDRASIYSKLGNNDDIISMTEDKALIDYEHKKYITSSFIESVIKLHDTGKLEKYIELVNEISFKKSY